MGNPIAQPADPRSQLHQRQRRQRRAKPQVEGPVASVKVVPAWPTRHTTLQGRSTSWRCQHARMRTVLGKVPRRTHLTQSPLRRPQQQHGRLRIMMCSAMLLLKCHRFLPGGSMLVRRGRAGEAVISRLPAVHLHACIAVLLHLPALLLRRCILSLLLHCIVVMLIPVLPMFFPVTGTRWRTKMLRPSPR